MGLSSSGLLILLGSFVDKCDNFWSNSSSGIGFIFFFNFVQILSRSHKLNASLNTTPVLLIDAPELILYSHGVIVSLSIKKLSSSR